METALQGENQLVKLFTNYVYPNQLQDETKFNNCFQLASEDDASALLDIELKNNDGKTIGYIEVKCAIKGTLKTNKFLWMAQKYKDTEKVFFGFARGKTTLTSYESIVKNSKDGNIYNSYRVDIIPSAIIKVLHDNKDKLKRIIRIKGDDLNTFNGIIAIPLKFKADKYGGLKLPAITATGGKSVVISKDSTQRTAATVKQNIEKYRDDDATKTVQSLTRFFETR